ncbi:MAG: hypothetical protein WCD44_03465 [Candidatus Babeliales bacterium]
MKNNRFNRLLAILFCATITIFSFCKVKNREQNYSTKKQVRVEEDIQLLNQTIAKALVEINSTNDSTNACKVAYHITSLVNKNNFDHFCQTEDGCKLLTEVVLRNPHARIYFTSLITKKHFTDPKIIEWEGNGHMFFHFIQSLMLLNSDSPSYFISLIDKDTFVRLAINNHQCRCGHRGKFLSTLIYNNPDITNYFTSFIDEENILFLLQYSCAKYLIEELINENPENTNNTAKLFGIISQEPIHTFTLKNVSVDRMNDHLVAIRYENNTGKLFDTIKQKIIHTFHNIHRISSVNDYLVKIEYKNNTAALFDPIKEKTIHTFHNIHWIKPVNDHLVGICSNWTVELFDTIKKKTIHTFHNVLWTKPVNDHLVVIEYRNNTAELFDPIKQKAIHTFHNIRWIEPVNDHLVKTTYKNDTVELFDTVIKNKKQ